MSKDVLASFSHLPDSFVVTLTLGELRGKAAPPKVEVPAVPKRVVKKKSKRRK